MSAGLPSQNVYKSNALIESSYRLGVIEQRILLTCLSQIKEREAISDEVMYSVSVRDIGELAETDSKSLYADLAKAAQKLRRKDVMLFEEPNTGNKLQRVKETSWVQTCVYIPKEGRVELRFNRDMIPYLSQLQQQFTRYSLSDVIRMTSANGIRIFELLVQYVPIGKRVVTVEDLRLWLRLEDAYPKVTDLRRKVVEPALAQVNEHSSLIVSCTPIFKNRRVVAFEFKMGWKAGRRGAAALRELRQVRAEEGNQSGMTDAIEDNPAPKKIRKVTIADINRYALVGESTEEARFRLENKMKRDGHLH